MSHVPPAAASGKAHRCAREHHDITTLRHSRIQQHGLYQNVRWTEACADHGGLVGHKQRRGAAEKGEGWVVPGEGGEREARSPRTWRDPLPPVICDEPNLRLFNLPPPLSSVAQHLRPPL